VGIGAIALTAALSAVPLVIIAVAVIAEGGADGNTLAAFDPSQTSWDAVFHGILFAVTLFIGFETVAALGEEARRARRSIPIAVISSILICLTFYLVVTYAGAIGFGKEALRRNAWFESVNAFGDLGDRYFRHTLGWLVSLAIVVDLLSVLTAFTRAASRLLMALAREGLLPSAVARISRRFHSPVGGLTVITAWTLLVMLWAELTRYGDSVGIPNVLQAILILSATGSYLITLVYLLLAGGALSLLWSDRGQGGLWWRLPVVLAGVAVPILSFRGFLVPFPDPPNDTGFYFACAGLGLAALCPWGGLAVGRHAAVGGEAELARVEPEPADQTAPLGRERPLHRARAVLEPEQAQAQIGAEFQAHLQHSRVVCANGAERCTATRVRAG
jgi:amino acid transporter